MDIIRLTEQDFRDAADILNTEISVIKAVTEVESHGKGFLMPGLPKILFEGHVFWNQLKKIGKNPTDYHDENEDILYPKWDRKHYIGGVAEYGRLDRAIEIDRIAALKSASWGMFQIMGFNHHLCGFKIVENFVESMKAGEPEHLTAFIRFIISCRLDKALQDKNWRSFAKGYNGSGYEKNQYHTKLEKAYNKYKELK